MSNTKMIIALTISLLFFSTQNSPYTLQALRYFRHDEVPGHLRHLPAIVFCHCSSTTCTQDL